MEKSKPKPKHKDEDKDEDVITTKLLIVLTLITIVFGIGMFKLANHNLNRLAMNSESYKISYTTGQLIDVKTASTNKSIFGRGDLHKNNIDLIASLLLKNDIIMELTISEDSTNDVKKGDIIYIVTNGENIKDIKRAFTNKGEFDKYVAFLQA